jgi:membrane dipeptidase
MKRSLLFFPLLLALKLSAQNAQQIHQKAILIDTHNDVISNELITKVDLGKRKAREILTWCEPKKVDLDAQIFSIWCGENYGKGTAFAFANREIDSLSALIKRILIKLLWSAIPKN